jgi:hypothetical protein
LPLCHFEKPGFQLIFSGKDLLLISPDISEYALEKQVSFPICSSSSTHSDVQNFNARISQGQALLFLIS